MHIYRGKVQYVGDKEAAHLEQLTIILLTSFGLGEPVYICWQWTKATDADGDSKTNVIAQQFGTINSVQPDGDDIRIDFYSNGDYLFEALALAGTVPPFSSLRVWPKPNDGSILVKRFLLAADKVYSCQTSPTSQRPWNSYVGKLTFNASDTDNNSVNDETILVCLPETCAVNDPVCVYFQWTTKTDGSKKVNENLEGKLQSVDFSDGKLKIKFSAGTNYSFEGTYSAVGDSLELKMRDISKSDSATSDTISLDSIAPTKTRRTRRDVFRRVALVKNDTEETVIISLVDSGNSAAWKGRILAAAGAALTFAGIATGLSSAALIASMACGINIASAHFAVVTTVDTWINPDRAVEDVVLFPGHSVYRISNWFWGNSNAQVLQFKIEGDKTLNLYSSVKDDLGDRDWTLSQTMEGIAAKKIFSITLDAAKTIVYRGFVQIEGFKPVVTKSDDVEQGNLLELDAETMLTSDLDGKNPKNRGIWTKNNISFEWDNTKFLYYVQPSNSSGVARSVSHHQSGRLSLRLRGYKVTTADFHKFLASEKDFNDEEDVLRFMGNVKVGHHVRVCSWEKGKELYSYGGYNNGDLKLEKADSSDSFVFLLIMQFQPYQKMV
ncbi:hypothetical protein JMJ35_010459 [Cladonia borealis]|uniref:Uncharacterized protein n=1 Tax=Cladonia borealis TaxID=184061 RepID=A0AA39QS34_9LECA|nr:hypothetical protein JMJ35_010459 [Cladonia borealis]